MPIDLPALRWYPWLTAEKHSTSIAALREVLTEARPKLNQANEAAFGE